MLQSVEIIYQMMWRHWHPLPVLAGPVLLAVGIKINRAIPSTSVLDWSPFHVRANVTLLPLRTRAWPLYLLVLAATIPILATLEELVFRVPIHTVAAAILLGGIGFGFAHLTSLVSLRMCLYLTVIGWLFTGVYLLWGFWPVVLLHASYNLAALSLVARDRLLPQAQPTT